MKEADCFPGKRIGRLVLQSRERVHMKLYGNRWVWTCLCDCGNIVKEPTFKLGGNKGVKSCGCRGISVC